MIQKGISKISGLRGVLMFLAFAGVFHKTLCAQLSDSIYYFGTQVPAIDSPKAYHDYSRTDFCNCTPDKLGDTVGARVVDTGVIASHRDDRDFQYERTVKDEASTFWSNFENWLSRKLFGSVDRERISNAMNTVYWCLAVLAVLLVAYWLYRSELLGSPFRRTTRISESLFGETERSEEDIDALIGQAVGAGNYVLAIRWLYIKCIKNLSSRQQLEIRQDKTNYDYYLELKGGAVRDAFRKLTVLFEYSNYGKFDTGVSDYREANETLNLILSKI
jgi:hypothetical protein